MPVYLFIDAAGDQCFVEADTPPDGAIAVPRLPGPFERWDRRRKAWVYDAEGHADARAGIGHIAAMRARKAIEAHLIAAGVSAPGMIVVREAQLRGVAPEELAAVIIGKAATAESIEIERQAASLGVNDKEKKGG